VSSGTQFNKSQEGRRKPPGGEPGGEALLGSSDEGISVCRGFSEVRRFEALLISGGARNFNERRDNS
jgi:hypothetical protein